MRGLPEAARDERGFATVVTAVCIAVVLVCAVTGWGLLAVGGARVRAATAADLAALAAAGSGGCAAAAPIASGNGAELVSCVQDGAAYAVVVAVPVRAAPLPVGPAGARVVGASRAGP